MDQELIQYLDGRFNEVNDRIDEVKRHSGVLVEGLRHEVQLLAEGFATFIEVRYAQDQAKIDRRFDETNALIRSSYSQLHQRVENLERNRPN
jgi:ubiquinone biosynthesis protein UbiJ